MMNDSDTIFQNSIDHDLNPGHATWTKIFTTLPLGNTCPFEIWPLLSGKDLSRLWNRLFHSQFLFPVRLAPGLMAVFLRIWSGIETTSKGTFRGPDEIECRRRIFGFKPGRSGPKEICTAYPHILVFPWPRVPIYSRLWRFEKRSREEMPRSGLLDENSANYHTRALVSFLILLLSSNSFWPWLRSESRRRIFGGKFQIRNFILDYKIQ